jgi:hypothetical protein
MLVVADRTIVGLNPATVAMVVDIHVYIQQTLKLLSVVAVALDMKTKVVGVLVLVGKDPMDGTLVQEIGIFEVVT